MMPIMVKKNENTKFIATIALRAFSFPPSLKSFPATKYCDKIALTTRERLAAGGTK